MIYIKNILSENELEQLKNDALLNKEITNISNSNTYQLLFDSPLFTKIIKKVICELETVYGENFEVYCKNILTFINDEEETELIYFNKNINDVFKIFSKYSFIFQIQGISNINFLENINQDINSNDLLIFKNNFFYKDNSIKNQRICLIGSITNEFVNSTEKIII